MSKGTFTVGDFESREHFFETKDRLRKNKESYYDEEDFVTSLIFSLLLKELDEIEADIRQKFESSVPDVRAFIQKKIKERSCS